MIYSALEDVLLSFFKNVLHQELNQAVPPRYPNAFTVNPTPSSASPSTAATLPVVPIAGAVSTSAPEADTLKIEEVQPPATGTRKAKVLYDYDAADTSEMSLLADEVRCTHTFSYSTHTRTHTRFHIRTETYTCARAMCMPRWTRTQAYKHTHMLSHTFFIFLFHVCFFLSQLKLNSLLCILIF